MEAGFNYFGKTKLLDYDHASIKELVNSRDWQLLNDTEKVKAVYNFVRDEIRFGYNVADDIPASQVLADGYGQCNTKATLLMALLRAVGIRNRIHGFTIDKVLQKGVINGIWYKLSPKNILHSWVEVNVGQQWYVLEGVILDKPYLAALQQINRDCTSAFCGFGVYTYKLQNPVIDWDLNSTFIQSKGINKDFGLFDTPDSFYEKHQQELNMVKRFLFRHLVRHIMNRNVERIRRRFTSAN